MNKKKLTMLALAMTLVLGMPIVAKAVDTHPPHTYSVERYLYTTQEGSYTHQYFTGYVPGTTIVTYGTCTVMCEREYYLRQCKECTATAGTISYYYETHGPCGQ